MRLFPCAAFAFLCLVPAIARDLGSPFFPRRLQALVFYGEGPHVCSITLLTVALLGYDGGEIKRRGLADFPIVVRSDYIPRIQEVQATIYHTMREMLEVVARD